MGAAAAAVGVMIVASLGSPALAATAVPVDTSNASTARFANHRIALTKTDTKSSKRCDAKGDRRGGNDCVTHRQLRSAADGSVDKGKHFSVRVFTHKSLKGQHLDVRFQYRQVSTKGKHGKWHTGRRANWLVKSRTHDFRLRAPKKAGRYQVRTKLTLAPPSRRTGAMAALRALPSSWSATSGWSSLAAGTCVTSPDDEVIIEYFNEAVLYEDIVVRITDTGSTFQLLIICPQTPSPSYPSPNFDLTMFTGDQTQQSNCDTSTPIVLQKTQMSNYQYCSGSNCRFLVILKNRTTQIVYSTTEMMWGFVSGNAWWVPNYFESATLPTCHSYVPPRTTAAA